MLKHHVEFYNRCSTFFISNQLNLRTSDSFERKTIRKAFIVVNYNCAVSSSSSQQIAFTSIILFLVLFHAASYASM